MTVQIVLLCSEGGRGQGHLFRLRRIAEALREYGATCIAAIADIKSATGLTDSVEQVIEAPTANKIGQSPPALRLSPEARDTCNITMSLWQMGFWHRQTITTKLQGWDQIFAAIRPAAVVADLAPFALLAAAGRMPTFAVGNGFSVPALINGYFTPDTQLASSKDRAVQDVYFANIRKAFEAAGLASPASIPNALCSDIPCPATLPALDPKYELRRDRLLPPELDEIPEAINTAGEDILMYLGTDLDQHQMAIRAVAATGRKAILYVPTAVNRLVTLPANIERRKHAFTADEIASRAGVVVHHGGVGITHLAALAGVPQMFFYHGPERWANSRAVWRVGAGGGRAGDDLAKTNEAARLIQSFLRAEKYRIAARDWRDNSLKWMAGRRGQDHIAKRIAAKVLSSGG